MREKGVKRKGPKKYKRKKTGERIEKRKQGTTGEKYYRRGVFLGETEERKGSQQRSGEEREVTEEEIKKIPEKKNNHSCHRASSPPPQHTT